MDSTTVTDEEFGPNGQVIKSTTRTIMERSPTIQELAQTRRQVRMIMNNNLPGGVTVPVWGRTLAKYMLMITWYLIADRMNEDDPTPI